MAPPTCSVSLFLILTNPHLRYDTLERCSIVALTNISFFTAGENTCLSDIDAVFLVHLFLKHPLFVILLMSILLISSRISSVFTFPLIHLFVFPLFARPLLHRCLFVFHLSSQRVV